MIVLTLDGTNASADCLRLNLYAKDSATWSIRPRKGSATLDLDRGSGAYRLHASGLRPAHDYALITHTKMGGSYQGYWLATARSSAKGELLLISSWRNWLEKVWLVPASDVRGRAGDDQPDRLRAWRPETYLFEERLLQPPVLKSMR